MFNKIKDTLCNIHHFMW